MAGKRQLGQVFGTIAVLVLAGVILGRMHASRAEATWQAGQGNQLVVLRVVANSDSTFDQAVKLRVRDAVLAAAGSLSLQAQSPQGLASAQTRQYLTALAERVLVQAQAGYHASVIFAPDPDFFQGWRESTGERYSLKIVLGKGQGHNWWCVVFPPLCLNDLTVADAPPPAALMAMWQVGMGPGQPGNPQSQKELWEKTPVHVRLAILDWLKSHGSVFPGWRSWLLGLEEHARRQ